MNQKFDTSIASIEDLGRGLIRVRVKKGVVIDEQGIKECRVVYNKVLNGQKGLFLTIFSEFNTAERGVKAEFESGEHTDLKAAEAFVLNNVSNRIELDYYTQMTKTLYPTAVFNDEKEAIKWLLDFHD